MINKEFVSIIIVMRNEEKYIEKCLLSILNQDYPKDNYEIIIVDGMSDDKSVQIINKYKKSNNFRLFFNEKKTLASGWNIGIKNSKGSIVIRPDAHSTIESNFIKENIKTLQDNPDAICVGGRINSISKNGKISTIISAVLSSPFGVGNSQFRIGNKSGYVDTVAYGAYKKEIFEQVGFFNEYLERNQDLEMHSRIKRNGGKFYFNPKIKSNYYTRSTVKGFVKQAYKNGKWNIITLAWERKALSIRHLIPLIFVLSLIINISLSMFSTFFLLVLICEAIMYLIGSICATINIFNKIRKKEAFISVVLFFLLHTSYGIGSIIGFIKLPKYKKYSM